MCQPSSIGRKSIIFGLKLHVSGEDSYKKKAFNEIFSIAIVIVIVGLLGADVGDTSS